MKPFICAVFALTLIAGCATTPQPFYIVGTLTYEDFVSLPPYQRAIILEYAIERNQTDLQHSRAALNDCIQMQTLWEMEKFNSNHPGRRW